MDPVRFPELAVWCSSHPTISQALTFEPPPSGVAIIGFPLKRLTTHLETQRQLETLLESTTKKLTLVESQLRDFIDRATPNAICFDFDEIEPILFLRKHTFVLREIHQHFVSLYTSRDLELRRDFTQQQSLVDLFESSLIPLSLLCRLHSDVLNWGRSQVVNSPLEIELRYLQEMARRMVPAIEHLPRVLWVRSFEEFLSALLAPIPIDPDVGYFPIVHLEHALSRYFFSSRSEQRERIDAILAKIATESSETFSETLMHLCRSLIPRSVTAVPHAQSKALLVFYRALFNRCYEVMPGFFAAHRTRFELLEKVDRIRNFPAGLREFCLPWDLLPPVDHTIPIRQVFQNHPRYMVAAASLSMAALESNPFDQLYRIHSALSVLQETGNSYRHPDNPSLWSEMLSFDELFALFFGVLMAADFADPFFVRWMITEFAPKSWLSPSFEYAFANLDALVVHLEQIDLAALELSAQ
jgi:hypothetical protein